MRIVATIFLSIVSLIVLAVPAERIRKKLMLVDGTDVIATLVGNEDYSYYVTDYGTKLAAITTDEGIRYQYVDSETENERKLAPARRIGIQETAPLKSYGIQHIPVVLVAFSDKAFSVADNAADVNTYYQKFCNGELEGQLYTGAGSHGSVRDYFVEQSDSTFLPEFTVIGPVTLDHPYSYYGKNSSSRSKDIYFSAFCKEALNKAMSSQQDWLPFDNDKDGTYDMVFFIYAGLGENSGGDEDTIWPKEMPSGSTINGMTFGCEAAACELHPSKWNADRTQILSTKGDGVGVFIHELSHALGLPDFYDTVTNAFGMDLWSIMDYGEYGNNGYNPGGYTAYERDFMGWRELETLDGPCTLRISPFADGGIGYKIVNDYNSNEYYVMENRQAKGWDDRICQLGHGLQITHVDYSQTKWLGNVVNTDSLHQRMTIIAANNKYTGSSSAKSSAEWKDCLAGNLFPGNTFNYNLTDNTYPASEVYSGYYMRKPIQDICEDVDGLITLKYCAVGTLDTPADLASDDVTMSGFTLSWAEVANAECYRVQLLEEDSVIQERDSLYATTCQFGGLNPSTTYMVRVKAMADTYLNSLNAEAEVSTLTDAIELVPESEDIVRVYELNGSFVTECFADELKRLSLHRGVYIIRSMSGDTKKMLIE